MVPISPLPGARPHGIWVPLATPMRLGALDLDRLQMLADSMIKEGAHGLVACGTTGEAATLTPDERAAVLSAVLEVAQQRCPVLMGIGSNDTAAAVAQATQFDTMDLAGYLVSTPSYIRPSQAGLQRHFETIADATNHPIVLYNVPGRTGVDLALATVQKLALRPQFTAIKEASTNLQHMSDLVAQVPLTMLCGEDSLLFAALCAGGHGAISATAHLRPDLFVQLYHLVQSQQLVQARALFQLLRPMIGLLFAESNPAPLKAVLTMRGLLREELRLPLTPVSASLRVQLSLALQALMDIPSYPPRMASTPLPARAPVAAVAAAVLTLNQAPTMVRPRVLV